MDLPEDILSIIGSRTYQIDSVGRSGDLVLIFKNKYILKISNSKNRLLREKTQKLIG